MSLSSSSTDDRTPIPGSAAERSKAEALLFGIMHPWHILWFGLEGVWDLKPNSGDWRLNPNAPNDGGFDGLLEVDGLTIGVSHDSKGWVFVLIFPDAPNHSSPQFRDRRSFRAAMADRTYAKAWYAARKNQQLNSGGSHV